jgi:hypothetical protein
MRRLRLDGLPRLRDLRAMNTQRHEQTRRGPSLSALIAGAASGISIASATLHPIS